MESKFSFLGESTGCASDLQPIDIKIKHDNVQINRKFKVISLDIIQVQRTVKAAFKRLYSLTEKYQAAAGFDTHNLAKYRRPDFIDDKSNPFE